MSSNDKLKISLEARTDSNNNKYFIGKLKGPFTIDCKDGIAFLVFCSESGFEELQIAGLDNQDKQKSNYQKHKPEIISIKNRKDKSFLLELEEQKDKKEDK